MKILVKAIIEIAGFPEEHVKNTMDMVMSKVAEEKGIKIISKDVVEIEKIKEMWSTFSDMELEFEDINLLNDFCFNYMPSSIEIIDPNNLNMSSTDVSNLLNDLLARLHNFTMFLKNLQAENMNLKRDLEKKG